MWTTPSGRCRSRRPRDAGSSARRRHGPPAAPPRQRADSPAAGLLRALRVRRRAAVPGDRRAWPRDLVVHARMLRAAAGAYGWTGPGLVDAMLTIVRNFATGFEDDPGALDWALAELAHLARNADMFRA